MVQPLKEDRDAAATATATGPRVAYQGEPGAFSEEAVLAYFSAPRPFPYATWREVFAAVAGGEVEAGVVPLENSRAGTIRENLDLLYEYPLTIVGEVVVPVRLALLALPGQRLEEIRRVYSHVQALAQADGYLRSRPWQVLTSYNTAGAAKAIVERGERGAAAVASPRAAQLYGLEILARDIQGTAENRTRFVVLAQQPLPLGWRRKEIPATPPKTTLVFAVRNVPGSLYRCLGAFAERSINLSRLESRPWREREARWEYVFWVDVDADADAPDCRAALEELRGRCEMVRVLGTYPRAAE